MRRRWVDAAGRLLAFCDRRGLTDVKPLPSGIESCVASANLEGHRVVVKADNRDAALFVADVTWLRHHRSAPTVLEVDEQLRVLVLACIDGATVSDRGIGLDAEAEAAWLLTARDAGFAPTGNEEDVRVRYRRAFDDLVRRRAGRPWNVESLEAWLDWADSLDNSSWRVHGLDVIGKNTLVDDVGRWWAIDPSCAIAPDAAVMCPWAVDRSAHLSRYDVDVQDALLAAFGDEASSLWMPGALCWTLWWCGPPRPDHALVLDSLELWLARWTAMVA